MIFYNSGLNSSSSGMKTGQAWSLQTTHEHIYANFLHKPVVQMSFEQQFVNVDKLSFAKEQFVEHLHIYTSKTGRSAFTWFSVFANSTVR